MVRGYSRNAPLFVESRCAGGHGCSGRVAREFDATVADYLLQAPLTLLVYLFSRSVKNMTTCEVCGEIYDGRGLTAHQKSCRRNQAHTKASRKVAAELRREAGTLLSILWNLAQHVAQTSSREPPEPGIPAHTKLAIPFGLNSGLDELSCSKDKVAQCVAAPVPPPRLPNPPPPGLPHLLSLTSGSQVLDVPYVPGA